MTIHDTARTMLAVLHAADACGDKGCYVGNHHPTADEKRLIAHLASVCPGLIQTVTDGDERWHAAQIDTPRGSCIGLYHVAPACYEPVHAFDHGAQEGAYHELVRLASEDRAIREYRRTVPADIHVGRRALSPPMDPAYGGAGSPDQRHALALRTVMQREASLLRSTPYDHLPYVAMDVATRLVAACDGAEDRAPDERQAVPTIVEDPPGKTRTDSQDAQIEEYEGGALPPTARCPCGKVGCVDPRPLASIGGQPLVHDGPDLESSIPGRW